MLLTMPEPPVNEDDELDEDEPSAEGKSVVRVYFNSNRAVF